MTASLPGVFNVQQFTDTGAPASGHRLYTYSPSTTTHKAAYTDAAASVPHTYTSDGAGGLYIGLNSRGELPAPLFLAAGGYDIALKTAAGATVWTRRAVGVDDSTAAITADLASTATGKGDALIGAKKDFTGAQARTQHSQSSDTATIFDFLPAGFVASSDATAYAQALLNSGVMVADFMGYPIKHDQVTVPAGVWAKNVNSTKYTNAAGNVIVVNAGSMVTGKIAGTGLTSAVQRGIYPAAAAVTDVALCVEVSNLTFGVQAAPVGVAGSTNDAKRWHGYIYGHDIVGTVGSSEGYCLLLESAEDCEFVVRAKNIRRHAVYFSAGARRNRVDLSVDGCGNYAAQFNSSSATQPANVHNSLTVRAVNLTTDVAGQSGALAILGNSHYNTCHVFCTGNAATYEAVRIEGGSIGVQADHPKGNKILDGCIDGQFAGGDVIRLINADGTHIRGNTIDAYATVSVIGMRRTGTNLSLHGGYVEGNSINAQGQSIKGIYDEITTVPSYIGFNDVRNNGTALRVDDQTSGKRMGYSRRVQFSGVSASISSGASLDVSVTLADAIQTTARQTFVKVSGASVDYTKGHAALGLAPSGETNCSFRLVNVAGSAQTLSYEATVEGD